MSRQYCAESQRLLFTIDSRSSLAIIFHLRSSMPAFVLPDCGCAFSGGFSMGGSSAGILGVPTSTGAVAFTWAGDE